MNLATSPTIADLLARISILQQENDRLRMCPLWGIYTRQGLELAWDSQDWRKIAVLYCDIDEMKAANSRWGCSGVNDRIAKALKQVRSSEVAGRYQMGDELGLIAPRGEASATARRIQSAFRAEGLSISIAIAPCLSASFEESFSVAEAIVERLKGLGCRGFISDLLVAD